MSKTSSAYNVTLFAPPTAVAMAPLTTRAGSLLRACPRQRNPALSSAVTSAQRRNKADIVQRTAGEYDRTPQFESPFRDEDSTPTTKIPSFAKYMSKKPESSNKVFQYFMVGSMGLLTAAGAKATVQGTSCSTIRIKPMGKQRARVASLIPKLMQYHTDFLVNMSASADVLAQAKVEIDLKAIPEGKNVWNFQQYKHEGWKIHEC